MRLSARMCRILLVSLALVLGIWSTTGPVHAQTSSQTRQVEKPDQDDFLPKRPRNLTHTQAAGHNVFYSGGSVMAGTAAIYAIFWEPNGNVSPRYNSLIERYFHDVGGSPLYRIARQYKQANGGYPSNAVLAGAWLDTRAYPHLPLLDKAIQREVTYAQGVNGWHSSLNNLFFVFTERNVNVCMDKTRSNCTSSGYCAYHSVFGNDTLYATIPYQSSFACDFTGGPNRDDADAAIDNISHEQMEAATDPLGDGWFDASGNEVGDKCVNDFGPLNARGANVVWDNHPYRVQKEWDNQAGSCRLAPRSRS